MSDFDAMVVAVHAGQELATTVIVDYILDRVDDAGYLTGRSHWQEYSKAFPNGFDTEDYIQLSCQAVSNDPDSLYVVFLEYSLGVQQELTVKRGELAAVLPAWLEKQLEVCHYVLSK